MSRVQGEHRPGGWHSGLSCSHRTPHSPTPGTLSPAWGLHEPHADTKKAYRGAGMQIPR